MQENLRPIVELIPAKITLPDELGKLTLNDLVNNPDTEIFKKGNKISFRQATPSTITTIEIEAFSHNVITTTKTGVYPTEKKKELLNAIQEMKSNGMQQKDIAFRLNISESYISKLLKENK